MVDLKYIGHSAFEIRNGDNAVLIDPLVSTNEKYDWHNEPITDILLTHAHGDHVGEALEIAKEKDIEITRRAYNDTTRSYNALIKKSPYKILASILGYSKRDFFDVDLVTKEEVAINFVDRRQGER